ncbi:nuclear transport factor 2 family protein [Streptomyces sp. NPDC001714]|uniref:nuclear transport factor 2 family protein n=1 Tax=Streptomyces sp. NPDC001714 TaxID=3364603 RepID=UPI0036B44829
MTDLAQLTDRIAIIELVDSIFDHVDAKEWEAAEALFTDKVQVDFSGLADSTAQETTNVDLVGGWRAGMHAKKSSYHFVGHHRVKITGDEASVKVKGYTYNLLDASLGSRMWEVWGHYEFAVRRISDGWRATGMTFTALHTRGDNTVRTHTLDS